MTRTVLSAPASPFDLSGDIMNLQRESEAPVSSNETPLQALSRHGPTVMYMCHTGDPLAITFISENVVEHFGYQPDELTKGRNKKSRLIHHKDRSRVLENLLNPSADGHQIHEYRLRRKDGSYRWVRDEVIALPSDNGGAARLGASNTPLRGGKGGSFEGGIRVPALIHWPAQLKPAKFFQQILISIDIKTTITFLRSKTPITPMTNNTALRMR